MEKIIYWIATGVMCAVFLFSSFMYLTKYDMITQAYQNLGFPTWMIYPSAILKILGVVAILSRKSKLLKEWAYAGFFFAFILAFFAHVMIGDGEQTGALVALVLLLVSYVFSKKLGKTV